MRLARRSDFAAYANGAVVSIVTQDWELIANGASAGPIHLKEAGGEHQGIGCQRVTIHQEAPPPLTLFAVADGRRRPLQFPVALHTQDC